MFKISRDWATPLAVGAFLIMATTGLLMFFHLDQGLNKPAHEWLGWLMVAAVGLHVASNWMAFKRYLLQSRQAQALLAVAALTLGASFLAIGGPEAPSPPLLALQAVGRAPMKDVLPLAGKTLAQAQAELAASGLTLRDGEQTLQQVTDGDRAKLGQALRVLFKAPLPA